MGAILLNDALWVLPDTPYTIEQYQWLTAEIQDMGGTAYYWKANAILDEHDQNLVKQFNAQVETVYSYLLKQMDRPKADLKKISQQYQQAASQDYFHSKLGTLVRDKLISKRGGK